MFEFIFIYNNRIFITGYNSSNGMNFLESGDMNKISNLPDIRASNINMVKCQVYEYTFTSYSEKLNVISDILTINPESPTTIYINLII